MLAAGWLLVCVCRVVMLLLIQGVYLALTGTRQPPAIVSAYPSPPRKPARYLRTEHARPPCLNPVPQSRHSSDHQQSGTMMLDSDVSTATKNFVRFLVLKHGISCFPSRRIPGRDAYKGEPDDGHFKATYSLPTVDQIFGTTKKHPSITRILRDKSSASKGFKASCVAVVSMLLKARPLWVQPT